VYVVDVPGYFYVPLEFNQIQNVQKMWGVYRKNLQGDGIGTVAFPSPVVLPYPIVEGYTQHWDIDYAGLAQMTVQVDAIGRGKVIEQSGGFHDSLLLRMEVTGTALGKWNGECLSFAWIDDDAVIRAFAITWNFPDKNIFRYNKYTKHFIGQATFFTLYDIEQG
jgi:hypothetical protein